MDTIRNEEFWLVVQKGYDAQVNGAYQEAKKYYDKAEKLSVSNEVLFFLSGENSYKLNDRFSSEIYFNRALAINPKFINPKLFRIEFLTEDKDYETALQLVNEALDANPIWYFYLKKAILLQLQAKNEEAKSILLSNCIPMNSFNYEQYIILGDIYLALNDVKNARESFMIAGNLNPNDKQYKKRMELLKQISEKSPESAPEPNR
jgi:tetratricopeptide (TPR) repeat protein